MKDTLRVNAFPLVRPFLLWGGVIGVIAGLVFTDVLVGFTVWVLFAIVGLLWRRDEPPALPFCFGYQWLSVAVGFFYYLVTSHFPGTYVVGDLRRAVLLSLVGLLVMTVGIRFGFRILATAVDREEARLQVVVVRYDIHRLFWLTLLAFSMDWGFWVIPGRYSSAGQIVGAVLAFKFVILFLFFQVMLGQREGYGYGAVLLLVAALSSVSSSTSTFAVSFGLFFLALLAHWQPWSRSRALRRRSWWLALGASVVMVVVTALLLVWSSGAKGEWRETLRNRGMEMSQIEKVTEYFRLFDRVLEDFDWEYATWSSVGRLSSGVGHFALTLNRVPDIVPYENGRLTQRLVMHVLQPRVLFPWKRGLGGDSWLVERYAGIHVGGDSQGTSIGFTYMGEMYVDFGPYFMFVPLLMLGVLVGLLYRGLILAAPSRPLHLAAVTVLSQYSLTSYDSELAKTVGGMLIGFATFALIFYLVGASLHGWLARESGERAAALSAPVETGG